MTIAEPGTTEALAAAVAAGDEGAFGALYEELFDPVWRYVASRVGRDRAAVEDIVQESFLALVRALPAYREEGRLFGFVFAIVRQRLAAWYRSRGRAQETLPEGIALALVGEELPEDILERREVRELVHRALLTLAPRHRDVLALRYTEGLKFAEVADRTGLSTGAAKSLVRRAKESLEKALGVEAGSVAGGER